MLWGPEIKDHLRSFEVVVGGQLPPELAAVPDGKNADCDVHDGHWLITSLRLAPFPAMVVRRAEESVAAASVGKVEGTDSLP